MTRPTKQGVDYFPLDVDIDSDDKITLVEAQYGLEGFAIVIKLFLKIYRNGYYYRWTEREKLLFVKKTGAEEALLEGVVASCLKWGIFDNSKFKSYKILTSRGIQRRYFEIVKRRSEVEVEKKYIIKGVNVNNNLVNVNNNPINECNNPHSEKINADSNTPSEAVNVNNNPASEVVNADNNPASEDDNAGKNTSTEEVNDDIYKQSKVKESKEKKSKGNKSKEKQAKVEENIGEKVNEIINYLNKQTGKKFRYQNPDTITLIEEKINQGFDIDDFKKVIRIKKKEWLGKKKMDQYLRPPTLFGKNFESYLNQKEEDSQESIEYKKL